MRALVAALSLLAALTACRGAPDGGSAGPGGPGGAGGPGGPQRPSVRVVEAREEVVDRIVEITGTLAGAEEVTVSAETDGRVDRVAAELGDAVAKGGLLAQLSPTAARLAADQAEADFLQALARLGVDDVGLDTIDPARVAPVRRAEADLEEARRNARRVEELFKGAVVTQADLDTVHTRERVADAAAQQAREEAAAAVATARSRRAALGLARKRLADTSVSSPLVGVVSERLVSLGELVKAGQPVARVVVANPLKLKGDVPERYVGEVRPEQSVQVSLDALGAEVTGRIARVGPAVASSSRTFRIEALIDNPDGRLKPGLFARARLTIGKDEAVIAIPETAVASVAGVTKVFVLEDGRAAERKVEVLRKRGSDALVVGELKAGEQVIVTAIARLFSGAEVAIEGAGPAPGAPPPGPGVR